MRRHVMQHKSIGEIGDAKLRAILQEIKQALQGELRSDFRLFLFGSYARNKGRRDSDVDLMVILPDEKCSFEVKEKVREVVYDFSLRSEYLFSVIIVSRSLAEERQGFLVFAAIEKEGVPI